MVVDQKLTAAFEDLRVSGSQRLDSQRDEAGDAEAAAAQNKQSCDPGGPAIQSVRSAHCVCSRYDLRGRFVRLGGDSVQTYYSDSYVASLP
jgi:hypothetical protein